MLIWVWGAQDKQAMAQPDELIDFHHLKSRRGMSQLELEDEVATDLQKATGLVDTHTIDSSHLNRVLQLTGSLLPLGVCFCGRINRAFMPCSVVNSAQGRYGQICANEGITWQDVPAQIGNSCN